MRVHELIKQLSECNQEATAMLAKKQVANDGDGYIDTWDKEEPVKKITEAYGSMVIIT